jgi:hypothetical protein
MSTTDDIQKLAEQTHRDLDTVHDFFHHSKTLWMSLRILVEGGQTLISNNAVTGNTLDQNGLLRLAPQYAKDYLATFTFRQFVSTFESFLFSLLQYLLRHNPWQFAKSQLDFELVLRASNREEIISAVIVRKLNDLKYERIGDWFEAINKAVNLGCPSDDEIAALAEIKATRDILEHNAGVVNETYIRKAGKRARFPVGRTIEIDDTYHLESWQLIRKVVVDTSAAAIAHLPSPAPPPP